MSIYSNVTVQDLINLRKLAEQQEAQQALEVEHRILKQTYDNKFAESLTTITKKLNTVTESIKIIGEVNKDSNSENENNQEIVAVKIESEHEKIHTKLRALPNSSIFSELMTKTPGSLMSNSNSLKKSSPSGTTNLKVPIYTLGDDRIRISDNIYDITPEIHKAFPSTSYTGNTMKNENDFLMKNNIIRDSDYTCRGDTQSNRKAFFTKSFPKLVKEIQNKTLMKLQTALKIYKEEK